jgi:hypothetical protein
MIYDCFRRGSVVLRAGCPGSVWETALPFNGEGRRSAGDAYSPAGGKLVKRVGGETMMGVTDAAFGGFRVAIASRLLPRGGGNKPET